MNAWEVIYANLFIAPLCINRPFLGKLARQEDKRNATIITSHLPFLFPLLINNNVHPMTCCWCHRLEHPFENCKTGSPIFVLLLVWLLWLRLALFAHPLTLVPICSRKSLAGYICSNHHAGEQTPSPCSIDMYWWPHNYFQHQQVIPRSFGTLECGLYSLRHAATLECYLSLLLPIQFAASCQSCGGASLRAGLHTLFRSGLRTKILQAAAISFFAHALFCHHRFASLASGSASERPNGCVLLLPALDRQPYSSK